MDTRQHDITNLLLGTITLGVGALVVIALERRPSPRLRAAFHDAEEEWDDAGRKVKDGFSTVRRKAAEGLETLEDKAGEVRDKVSDKLEAARERLRESARELKDRVRGAIDNVRDIEVRRDDEVRREDQDAETLAVSVTPPAVLP
jgi:gas vesicle protein